jgi:2-polyprenyl-3-methyl-5-hydroxy-6-metoxy-1,4-benzoquinol methylase
MKPRSSGTGYGVAVTRQDLAATPTADLTFLSPPGEVADWRMILLWDVAVTTGVVGALPATAEEVASRLSLEVQAVRAVLDALAVWEIVAVGADETYALGGAAPGEEATAAIRHHARALRRWTALDRRLRGQTDAGPGGWADPESFHDALAVSARQRAPHVVDVCLRRFPQAKTVLDLGGLHGEYSLEFTRRGLKATMQDQPKMIDVARRRGRLEAAGVKLFEGSFFEVVPDGPFDLAFCSGITHTFDGQRNLALYRNLRGVVAPGGGVAIVTFLRRRNPLATLFAVQMLMNDNGGDTHTEDEYRAWLSEAAFTVDDGVLDLGGEGARSALFAT